MPGQIWRLKNPVETRRPFFLMSWISRLRFKKSGAHACPAVITTCLRGLRFDRASTHRSRVPPHVSTLFFHDQAKTTVFTPGDYPPPGCLPTCRLPSGRKESDGEASAALGSATSNNFAAVLSAHALPKSMFPLALEIRGLFKSERHCALLLERSFFNEEAAL